MDGSADHNSPGTPVWTGGWPAVKISIRYFLIFAIPAVICGVIIAYASDDNGYERYRPWMSEKLAVLRMRPPVPNAIFVGASVTLRSVVPSEVDAAAAAAGCQDVHSINLGILKARLFETAFMLDRVLETPDLPAGAFIIFDGRSSDEITFEEIAASERTPVTARFRYLPDLVGSAPWSWDHFWRVSAYFRAALGETLAFHSLSDIAMQRWRQEEQFDPARVVERGYIPLEAEDTEKQRNRYLNRGQKKHLQYLQNWNVEEYLDDPSKLRVNPFAQRIREAGFVPVAYAAPWMNGSIAATVKLAKQADPGLSVIAITRENAPEIYAGNEFWFDRGHMNEAGAKLVSSIIGRELCHMMKNS